MVSEEQRTAEKQNDQEAKVPKDLAKKEYTAEEKARIAKYFERLKREPIKVKNDEAGHPQLVHKTTDKALSDAKFMEALGTPDSGLQVFLLDQVIRTFRGCVSSDGINNDSLAEFVNNALALLNGIQPRDEIEGMLVVQMIAVHNLAMETMGRVMITDQTFQGREANVNYATKMLRTFTAQMEALKRYRTGGQQRVIVEHVYVTAGGQAIVGVVNRGGEGNSDKRG